MDPRLTAAHVSDRCARVRPVRMPSFPCAAPWHSAACAACMCTGATQACYRCCQPHQKRRRVRQQVWRQIGVVKWLPVCGHRARGLACLRLAIPVGLRGIESTGPERRPHVWACLRMLGYKDTHTLLKTF